MVLGELGGCWGVECVDSYVWERTGNGSYLVFSLLEPVDFTISLVSPEESGTTPGIGVGGLIGQGMAGVLEVGEHVFGMRISGMRPVRMRMVGMS